MKTLKKKAIVSSPRAKQDDETGVTITRVYRSGEFPPLSAESKARLRKLAERPDDEIDYSDIPPLPEGWWKTAVRNPFFKPVKKQITLRLDADVIAWLRDTGKGYQTRLNEILRKEMRREKLEMLLAAEKARDKAAKPSAATRAKPSQAALRNRTATKRTK